MPIYVLTLEKASAGVLSSFTPDVVKPYVDPRPTKAKEPQLRSLSMSMPFGVGIGKPVYEWIRSFLFSKGRASRSGTVVVANPDGKVLEVHEFHDATIRELSFPAINASSKDAGLLTLELTSREIVRKEGSGKKIDVPSRPKSWSVKNFELQIGSLPCQNVIKIGSFAVRKTVETSTNSSNSSKMTAPGPMFHPILGVTSCEVDADAWVKWCRNGTTKTGSLRFLSTDLQNAMATLTFKDMQINSVQVTMPGKFKAQVDATIADFVPSA